MTARHRTAWTFAITSSALFMASLDNLVVTTALPSIWEQLHASLEGLQWTVNAYTLTFAVLLLSGGALGRRAARRGWRPGPCRASAPPSSSRSPSRCCQPRYPRGAAAWPSAPGELSAAWPSLSGRWSAGPGSGG